VTGPNPIDSPDSDFRTDLDETDERFFVKPNPIDTIREALAAWIATGPPEMVYTSALPNPRAALAALTEVEHQLADQQREVEHVRLRLERRHKELNETDARAVAAETALAEARQDIQGWKHIEATRLRQIEAAERRADDLADALRRIADAHITPKSRAIARAALDRQEQPDA
jgi:hypothetical protein